MAASALRADSTATLSPTLFHNWKKFKFFHMTDVKTSEILDIRHVFDEKMSPHMENLCYFVVKSVLS